jgi:hypothetical protein
MRKSGLDINVVPLFLTPDQSLYERSDPFFIPAGIHKYASMSNLGVNCETDIKNYSSGC